MNPKDLKPGPIRHARLPPEFLLRIEAIRSTLSEVCALSEAEWQDAFQRDANRERELVWWERVARCYSELQESRNFSTLQRKAVFSVIFGLFSGLDAEQLQPDLAKLPESAMDDLAVIIQRLGVVN